MTTSRLPVWISVALGATFALAACTTTSRTPPTPRVSDTAAPSTGAVSSADPSATGAGSTSSASAEPAATASPPAGSPAPTAPAWVSAALTDVSTGETVRLADMRGRVVIVETMAIWCSNCRVQQGAVKAALAQLPPDRVSYVVIDVDPNEDAASLARYRQQNGFDGHYVIAGREVARALAADLGDQFLNPPSTPIVIIGADGTIRPTDFGQKSVDQLVSLARAAGA